MDCLEETFHIGRELGVPVVISHHKVVGQANHGRSVQTLARIAEQMKTQPVCLDCYPYNASSTILEQALVDGAARVIVTWSKAHPRFSGRDLDEVARELGCPVEEAVRRLQPAGAIYFRMHEDDVARILQFDETMVGSDGCLMTRRRTRAWGSFPRVLGHYARGLGLFPLEKAIHKMTGLTAARFGLADRGVLREGAHADLVLLDAGRWPIAPPSRSRSRRRRASCRSGPMAGRYGGTARPRASGRGRCCVARPDAGQGRAVGVPTGVRALQTIDFQAANFSDLDLSGHQPAARHVQHLTRHEAGLVGGEEQAGVGHSGVPSRRSAVTPATASLISCGTLLSSGVLMRPGARPLTVTSCSPSSAAQCRVRPISAVGGGVVRRHDIAIGLARHRGHVDDAIWRRATMCGVARRVM